jgi:hypothetical protein
MADAQVIKNDLSLAMASSRKAAFEAPGWISAMRRTNKSHVISRLRFRLAPCATARAFHAFWTLTAKSAGLCPLQLWQRP